MAVDERLAISVVGFDRSDSQVWLLPVYRDDDGSETVGVLGEPAHLEGGPLAELIGEAQALRRQDVRVADLLLVFGECGLGTVIR